MSEGFQQTESIVIQVPEAMDSTALLEGLSDSVVVPRLRGGDLTTTITIALDVLTSTASVVQLLVARHELAEFGNRLIRWQRAQEQVTSGAPQLEVSNDSQTKSVDPESDTAEDDFVRAIVELLPHATPDADIGALDSPMGPADPGSGSDSGVAADNQGGDQ